MEKITQKLAKFAIDLNFSSLPLEVVERVKLLSLEIVSVILLLQRHCSMAHWPIRLILMTLMRKDQFTHLPQLFPRPLLLLKSQVHQAKS